MNPSRRRGVCLNRCARPAGAVAALLFCAAANGQTCTVGNATLVFGSYNPVSGSATTANTTITVQCSEAISATTMVPYVLLLSAGASGNTGNRQMTGTAHNLPYNVYTSASYATVWDNTVGVNGSVTLVGLLGLPLLTYGNSSQTAYGRILAMQPVSAGAYTDALIITVTF
jgi:spore coat protein U-like protein